MAIRFKKLTIALEMLLVSSPALAHGHHSHGAPMSEAERKASEGIFDDSQMQNRALTSWNGVWQSIYPYLVSDEFDPMFKRRAEKDKSKTAEQVRAYYRTGYATNVDTTGIENGVMEFHIGNQAASCKYDCVGHKVLNCKSSKKGARCLSECKAANNKASKYVQFNDHIIAPRKSSHFHIFMGNTPWATLLEEMEGWPTYYPYQLKEERVVDEMLRH